MVNNRLMRDVVWKMMNKSNKKALLKSKEASLRNAKESFLVHDCFALWFGRFNTLRIKERNVTSKHTTLVKRQMMNQWKGQVQQVFQEQRQINAVRARVNRVMKVKVLLELQQYCITQRDKKQLNMVSRYFFINKVLKKTVNALRMNAKESKFQDMFGQKKDDKVLRECFEALNDNRKEKKKVKRFQILTQIH